jgi:D-3-phosphoglycerate dehydrogenase
LTKSVLLDNPIHPQAFALLEREVTVLPMYKASLPQLAQALAKANATIVSTRFPITEQEIRLGSRLEVIGRPGAGVDSVDIRAASEAGIPVVYTPAGPTESVAEHTLCFMLMLAKQMLKADAAVRQGDFPFRTRVKGSEIMGKTLGIIGGGHIGSRVAKICSSAFDMRVLLYDPYITPEQAQVCGGNLCAALDQIMTESDFVSIHTPLTSETHKLIGRHELAMMKRTAFLINTSRGPVVDEQALIAALREKRIAGAALDVFEQEPPDSDSPLFTLDNVALTPHMASFTDEGRYRMGVVVVQQVLDVLQGKRPQFLANPDVWERRRTVSD